MFCERAAKAGNLKQSGDKVQLLAFTNPKISLI